MHFFLDKVEGIIKKCDTSSFFFSSHCRGKTFIVFFSSVFYLLIFLINSLIAPLKINKENKDKDFLKIFSSIDIK